MKKLIRLTALAALVVTTFSGAHAATQTFGFTGTLDSGLYKGQSFSGNFSFDDASLLNVDTEWLNVGNLSMSFLGNTYTLANAAAPAEVGYFNGSFVGLSFTVESSEPKFSLIAGYDNKSQAYLAYDTAVLGGSGAGDVVYAAIPEPESLAMLLAGLGVVGVFARRRRIGV